MRILTFSTLFPNTEQPNNAIFVQHRMAAVNRFCDAEVKVVAPVPYYPNLSVGSARWQSFACVPQQERRAGMDVYHPRYLVTPKIGMTLYGVFMFMGALSVMRKLYREWPFDIIDAHYVYPDGLAACLLARYFRCPLVVSARGTDINLYSRFKLIRPLVRQVVIRADGLISVCRSLADIMVELGADEEKIRVIPNGIDPNVFFPLEQREARKVLGLDKKGKILLSVGTLIERKGMHLLIDALVILKRQGKLDFSTYIVGKGEMHRALQQRINDADLAGKVVLVGEVANKELGNWYNAADLFFLGSSREGWPNVVSEALACGTPVVATSVDGIPDILHSPRLGIVVERDIQAFADALQQGFQQTWDREFIQRQGQARTWNRVALDVYEVLKLVSAQ